MTQTSTHDARVSGMFSAIAERYDFGNHLLSLGIDAYWRMQLARAVRQTLLPCANGTFSGTVLDLAAGTLDVALTLRRHYPGIRIPAMDFCPAMLEIGRRKCQARRETAILPLASDAKAIPLRDASVDCITIAFGIRNILPRAAALTEMHRVLRPGGRVCILEFGSGRERIWFGCYNLYLTHILPAIGRLFSKDRDAYTYLATTICAFPSAEDFAAELTAAGFVNTHFKKLTSGIVCLHIGEKART